MEIEVEGRYLGRELVEVRKTEETGESRIYCAGKSGDSKGWRGWVKKNRRTVRRERAAVALPSDQDRSRMKIRRKSAVALGRFGSNRRGVCLPAGAAAVRPSFRGWDCRVERGPSARRCAALSAPSTKRILAPPRSPFLRDFFLAFERPLRN